jgi:hypothetical protein
MPGDNFLAREACRFHQRPYTDPATVSQKLETVPHENPVLSLQRHDVGNSGEGHEVQQVKGKIRRQTQRGYQRLNQLEGNAGSAQIIGAGGIVRPLRVDDRKCRRQLRARQVVIRDNDADALLPGGAYGVHGGDAAIACDDQRSTGGFCRSEAGGAEVIAIAETVRQEGNHICTSHSQGARQESG